MKGIHGAKGFGVGLKNNKAHIGYDNRQLNQIAT